MVLTTIPRPPYRSGRYQLYAPSGIPSNWVPEGSFLKMRVFFPKANYQTCTVDYDRNIIYLYDSHFTRIDARRINVLTSSEELVHLQTGVSRAFVNIALDWVSHNIYWTDPMFRWIAMRPGDPDITDTNMYKLIVKEDLQHPYALAVDSVGG